ncbi:hypothetical protein BBBOND_0110180 [Babesia bigemina]|uniref:Uncharacterized protein n=1 Tax=Babesia bigemina TaxID=5866 RepID=A0A061DAG9_BABBI|nr:hypothetical protein BBBOND_0110180 [Babesia bigemina]CDR94720.1 hypothetical protein BBBOND_0110180 [Babesia bigemina]|eukprot:XP_012766906.1 hypothetical protein BBBOND_0110180 [Babesia bigemina]
MEGRMAETKGTNPCGCDGNRCTKGGDRPCYDYKWRVARPDVRAVKQNARRMRNVNVVLLSVVVLLIVMAKAITTVKEKRAIIADAVEKNAKVGNHVYVILAAAERDVMAWCDPRNCSGEKCDGYVIGRCKDKHPDTTECKGHVKYDKEGAVFDRNAKSKIKCDETHVDCNDGICNKWARGKIDKDGNCIIECTYCGTLCGQDKFRRCCYIAIPVIIIVLLFLIFRFMLPEKFQSTMTKIRAAFPTSPRHPSRSLSDLVSDSVPDETNIDRYPAFRPRAYAGLS